MTSTAVFVEILFAGVQSAVWVSLILLGFFGLPPELGLDRLLKDNGAFVFFVAFSASYTLGVVNDRWARAVFLLVPRKCYRWMNGLLKNFEKRDVDRPSDVTRMEVIVREGKVTDFLDYVRSRVRIARSTAFNTAITIPSAIFFVWSDEISPLVDKIDIPREELSVWIFAIGLVVLFSAIFSYSMLAETYKRRRSQAKDLLGSFPPAEAKTEGNTLQELLALANLYKNQGDREMADQLTRCAVAIGEKTRNLSTGDDQEPQPSAIKA